MGGPSLDRRGVYEYRTRGCSPSLRFPPLVRENGTRRSDDSTPTLVRENRGTESNRSVVLTPEGVPVRPSLFDDGRNVGPALRQGSPSRLSFFMSSSNCPHPCDGTRAVGGGSRVSV